MALTNARGTDRGIGRKGQSSQFAEFLRPFQKSGSAVISFFPRANSNLGVVRNGGLALVLGRIGSLEVRLATRAKDIRRAQRLRFKVFYDERSAVPNPASLIARRDFDPYDAACDHLLVIDHAAKPNVFRPVKPRIVGTYRLLRQEVAERHFGFYSAGEYAIEPIINANPTLRFLELGRS